MNLRTPNIVWHSGRSSRGRWLGCLAGSLLVCTACSHPRAKPGVSSPAPVATKKHPGKVPKISPLPVPTPRTQEPRLGTIRVIGAHGSFVLIDTASALVTAAVPVGTVLHCRPPGVNTGVSTADLRVSPERRAPFVVADVIAGTPTVGDTAFLASDAPSPTASPEPVLLPSTLLPGGPPPSPTP